MTTCVRKSALSLLSRLPSECLKEPAFSEDESGAGASRGAVWTRSCASLGIVGTDDAAATESVDGGEGARATGWLGITDGDLFGHGNGPYLEISPTPSESFRGGLALRDQYSRSTWRIDWVREVDCFSITSPRIVRETRKS